MKLTDKEWDAIDIGSCEYPEMGLRKRIDAVLERRDQPATQFPVDKTDAWEELQDAKKVATHFQANLIPGADGKLQPAPWMGPSLTQLTSQQPTMNVNKEKADMRGCDNSSHQDQINVPECTMLADMQDADVVEEMFRAWVRDKRKPDDADIRDTRQALAIARRGMISMEELKSVIPSTFYAGLPTVERVRQLVRIMNNAVAANRELELELIDMVPAAEKGFSAEQIEKAATLTACEWVPCSPSKAFGFACELLKCLQQPAPPTAEDQIAEIIMDEYNTDIFRAKKVAERIAALREAQR